VDHTSRFLVLAEALKSTREDLVFPTRERLFRERGPPLAIPPDRGPPFRLSSRTVSAVPAFGLGASPSGGANEAILSRIAGLKDGI
jgi:hypothetical protein